MTMLQSLLSERGLKSCLWPQASAGQDMREWKHRVDLGRSFQEKRRSSEGLQVQTGCAHRENNL